jgi:hypothetical protein
VTDGSPELDTTVPHSARVWNYWLGGEDNYVADRLVGDQVMAMFPDITRLARADRAFLGRAVRYLVAGAGIRQFLDIGTGLPTAGNTHEVAQAIAPESRVVYVDNDPSWRTPAPCSPARPPVPPPISTPTCGTPARSWTGRPPPWTSPGPSRS